MKDWKNRAEKKKKKRRRRRRRRRSKQTHTSGDMNAETMVAVDGEAARGGWRRWLCLDCLTPSHSLSTKPRCLSPSHAVQPLEIW